MELEMDLEIKLEKELGMQVAIAVEVEIKLGIGNWVGSWYEREMGRMFCYLFLKLSEWCSSWNINILMYLEAKILFFT